jgi:hypothetical protein
MKISANLRQRVSEAAHFRCGYCLTSQLVIGPLLEIDHIIPEAHGGTSEETNLWLACPLCNSHKSDKTKATDPDTGEVVPLFNPRTQQWHEHFEWVEEGTVIRGKTPQGRATIIVLHLNDSFRVATRRLWVLADWHPPVD